MEEQYKALYDYDAQRNDELSLKAGDLLHILQHDSEEWCSAQNIETGQQGAVPTNHLELVTNGSTSGGKDNGPLLAKVLQDYAAQDPEELNLRKDGIVTVLDQSIADGWWKGDLNGSSGVFPANHVQLIDTQEKRSSDVSEENSTGQRQSFKLAAYGVKQGGIGSILAGGFGLRKKGHKKEGSATEPVESIPSSPEQPAISKPKDISIETKSADEKAMVLNAYDPENDDELKLIPGAYITITDKMDDQGWWKGVNENNNQGIFPSNFVQIISQETIPIRPARARPPTIMTDTQTVSPQKNQQPIVSPTSMAKPPPVPIGSRPSSLLTRKPTISSTEQAPAPASAPRPLTSPPVPSRRTNSVIKDNSPPQPRPRSQAHKRTPSIPLVSPDLPPIRPNHSHEQHPVRPSRPVPSPGSNNSSIATPTSPISEERIIGLAKVPKNFGKNQSGPLVPPRSSRPSSLASSVGDPSSIDEPSIPILPPPRAPKRSPKSSDDPQQHSRKSSNSSNDNHYQDTPPSPIPAARTLTKSDDGLADPLEIMLRQWFKEEAESLRQDFESRLEEERAHRMRLEAELESLKQHLA